MSCVTRSKYFSPDISRAKRVSHLKVIRFAIIYFRVLSDRECKEQQINELKVRNLANSSLMLQPCAHSRVKVESPNMHPLGKFCICQETINST